MLPARIWYPKSRTKFVAPSEATMGRRTARMAHTWGRESPSRPGPAGSGAPSCSTVRTLGSVIVQTSGPDEHQAGSVLVDEAPARIVPEKRYELTLLFPVGHHNRNPPSIEELLPALPPERDVAIGRPDRARDHLDPRVDGNGVV